MFPLVPRYSMSEVITALCEIQTVPVSGQSPEKSAELHKTLNITAEYNTVQYHSRVQHRTISQQNIAQ